jgi:hypothetical protein
MRLGLLSACAVLALSAGAAGAGTFSCEEINGVGNCGQLVQQTNQQIGGGTGAQTNSVTVNQSSGSSVTVTNVNGVCEIVVNGQPSQPC